MSDLKTDGFKTAESSKKRAALLLAVHSAPLLRGVKMANLMALNRNEIGAVKKLLKGTTISYRLYRGKNDRILLYLYRRKELRGYLFQKPVWNFLKEYGYQGKTLESMLFILSGRLELYRIGKRTFPHEIGVFLGYPLEDVQGFVKNHGRRYLYAGYWKVYRNEEYAKALFRRFDEEKKFVIREVLSGKTIKEIIV